MEQIDVGGNSRERIRNANAEKGSRRRGGEMSGTGRVEGGRGGRVGGNACRTARTTKINTSLTQLRSFSSFSSV